MARDASPISLVGVVTLRLSHVVSTKGQKGQKGTLSPGVSGYALNPRLFMRFLVPRTAVDTWINHVISSHKANICRCVYYKQSETLIVCEKMFNFAKMFFAI